MPDSETEGKKRAVGLGVFLLLFLMTTGAFCCTLASTGFCAFVSRHIQLSEPASEYCSNPDNGFEEDPTQCETFLQNHGIGFWGWQAAVANPIPGEPDVLVCLAYTQFVPGT